MYVKKFFNVRSGAVQMNFDLNETRVYITIANPFEKEQRTEKGAKRKFDWDNGLNYTIAEDNADDFLSVIKNVLSGKKENSGTAITYETPKVTKSIAFGQKSNGVFVLAIQHGDKEQRKYEFSKKEEAIRFYKIISGFFTNAFLANLIVDGILSKMKSDTKSNTYKNNKYNKQQNGNMVNKQETDNMFDEDDNVDETAVNEKVDDLSNILDLDDMF